MQKSSCSSILTLRVGLSLNCSLMRTFLQTFKRRGEPQLRTRSLAKQTLVLHICAKVPIVTLIAAVALVGASLSLPCEGFGAPASPDIHILSQPDGTTFKARQWGDEDLHGWETEEGYTIVFDRELNSWVYAVHGPHGDLVSSKAIVGKDPVPSWIGKKLRPKGEALLRIIPKRHTKELKALERFQQMRPGENAGPEITEPSVPLTGTAFVPTILINFSDTRPTYRPEDFNFVLFETGNYSMKDYFEEVSYGAFSISPGPAGILGWYTASKPHDYYGEDANVSGYKDAWAADLVYEAVAAADRDVDFSVYDWDGDCYVDVFIIHQGTGQEASGNPTDIWSHRGSLYGAYYYGRSHYSVYVTNDPCPSGGYIKIDDYAIVPEIYRGEIHAVGVCAHEYAHILGLPDLYDLDYGSKGIGDWSLMAYGCWNTIERGGDTPAHLDPWSKYFLGWVTPIDVSGTLNNHPITQAEVSPDVYRLLPGGLATGEYFLVENRQKTGFDAALPGAGLLIWHVDPAITNNNRECYPGGPLCSLQHYKVALIQADNRYDLERNINYGDAGDPYPGSSNNRTFNASSTPNSNLYDGSPSNVSVTNISDPGPIMTTTLTAPVLSSINKYMLGVLKSGTGTVTSSPPGIDCGADCSEAYDAGTVVTLTATADAGSVFSGWSGDCSGSSLTTTVTMDADKACTASFSIASGPDLTGSWVTLTQTCKNTRAGLKCKLRGTLKVENQGNQAASGGAFVYFYLSSDENWDSGDSLLKQVAVGSLKPGKSKMRKLSYSLPLGESAQGKYVIAWIDATEAIEETNEANNIVVSSQLQ